MDCQFKCKLLNVRIVACEYRPIKVLVSYDVDQSFNQHSNAPDSQ